MNDERWRYMLDQWRKAGYVHGRPGSDREWVAFPDGRTIPGDFALNIFWLHSVWYEHVAVDHFLHAIMFVERFGTGSER